MPLGVLFLLVEQVFRGVLISPRMARYRIRGMHSLLTSPLAKAGSARMSATEGRSSAAKDRKNRLIRVGLSLAAELGFEPRHTESESAVLPLHNSAK